MPNIREGLLNLVSGAPNSPYRGLLSPAASERARNTSLTDASIAMMLGSTGAPGAPAPTFMQALAGGLQAGRNSYGQVADAELVNRQALQQIATSQRTQAGQEALARHFAMNPITVESLKTGARIAASFGDMVTYKALLEQISTITPEVVPDERTDLERNYAAYLKTDPTPRVSWLEYKDSGKTPLAAVKPTRIPGEIIEDMIIVTLDPVTGEKVKTPARFGMTWEELDILKFDKNVTLESRKRTETARLAEQKDAAKETNVTYLSNDLLSVTDLLMGGNTGGRWRAIAGYIINDDEYNELGNLYAKLKAQFTLTKLAAAKEQGITFGALSDGEREMVANAVGRLEQSQSARLQLKEVSRIVGVFARHGLVDTSDFSAEFLALAEREARKQIAEEEKNRTTSSKPGSVTEQYGLE